MRIRIPIHKSLYFSFLFLILVTFAVMGFSKSATYYSSNTTMNASILFAIAITPSTALTEGIEFGELTTGTSNNMALNDTTGDVMLNTTVDINCTDYNLTVDSTTTFTVDFHNRAIAGFLNNSDNETIFIANVTLEANKSVTGGNVNYTDQFEPNTVKLNVTWLPIGTNATDDRMPCNDTANDGSGYCAMIYYLDVPSNQPSGVYNTTYCYCAVEVGAGTSNCACG